VVKLPKCRQNGELWARYPNSTDKCSAVYTI
jgi:hypothetical protein